MLNSKPPSGMRDTLPDELRKKEKTISQIKQIFEKFNYDPIDTPVLERIEVLNGKFSNPEENEKLIFQIQKRGEKADEGCDLGLRYDLTVPLARFYVAYKDKLPKVFKRYCVDKVWRAERPGKGRYREFYQCDIDTIGSESNLVELETFLALAEALQCFDLKNLSLKISSRNFLVKLLESFNIEKTKTFMYCLDKEDKLGLKGVLLELKEKVFDEKVSQEIIELLNSDEKLNSYIQDKPEILAIVEEVNYLVKTIAPLLKNIKVYFCKTLARGFDYYTGTVFEFYSEDLKSTIAGGGRFDTLTSIFDNKKTPACGGSIGIERIFGLLENQEKQASKNSVLISLFSEEMKQDCLLLLQDLTKNNINAEIYLKSDKLGDQIKYALSKNCKYLLIYGPEEKEKGVVGLKNLATKEQKEVKKEDLIKEIIF